MWAGVTVLETQKSHIQRMPGSLLHNTVHLLQWPWAKLLPPGEVSWEHWKYYLRTDGASFMAKQVKAVIWTYLGVEEIGSQALGNQKASASYLLKILYLWYLEQKYWTQLQFSFAPLSTVWSHRLAVSAVSAFLVLMMPWYAARLQSDHTLR